MRVTLLAAVAALAVSAYFNTAHSNDQQCFDDIKLANRSANDTLGEPSPTDGEWIEVLKELI